MVILFIVVIIGLFFNVLFIVFLVSLWRFILFDNGLLFSDNYGFDDVVWGIFDLNW